MPSNVEATCAVVRQPNNALQRTRLPIVRVGYFDTRRAIGVVTEIVGATKEGREFRRNLKAGAF